MSRRYFLLRNIIILTLACVLLCLSVLAADASYYTKPNVPAAIPSEASDKPIDPIEIPQFVIDRYLNIPVNGEDPDGGEFSCEIPESEPVDDSYFEDAVFIGDSRTVGMGMYGKIKSNYYAKVSLKIDTVFNTAFVTTENSEEPVTVIEAITENPTFNKVYISFGINELGYNRNVFINAYKLFVNQIREQLPDAVIYVQSIFPVSKAVSEKNRFGVNNAAVVRFNEAIKEMANELHLYYIDTYSLLADENGDLPASVSSDGIHLGPGQYSVMVSDYIRTHTVQVESES